MIQSLSEDVQNIEEMFVVALTVDGPVVYATGNLALLSFASLVLQDMAMKELNGEIDHGDGPGSGAG